MNYNKNIEQKQQHLVGTASHIVTTVSISWCCEFVGVQWTRYWLKHYNPCNDW